MKKVILIFFCLMLLPLTTNASQAKDADASSVQQEAAEAPDAIAVSYTHLTLPTKRIV